MFDELKSILEQKNITPLFCAAESIQKQLHEHYIEFQSNEDDFLKMEAAITYCEYLIAEFGNVLVSSQFSGRRKNVFPPIHIVIANTNQIVDSLENALIKLEKKYTTDYPSLISIITGPSRTADIEKTLILGAHGPKELIVFVVEK